MTNEERQIALDQLEVLKGELAEVKRKRAIKPLEPYHQYISQLLPQAWEQIRKVYPYAEEAAKTGQEMMRQPGVLNKIGGAAQWLGSPITGVSQAFVKDPTKVSLENIGVPEPYAEYTSDVAQMGAEALIPEYIIGRMRKFAPTVLKTAKDLKKLTAAEFGGIEKTVEKGIPAHIRKVTGAPPPPKYKSFGEWSKHISLAEKQTIIGKHVKGFDIWLDQKGFAGHGRGVLYHGANKEGTLAIEKAGTIGGVEQPIFLTPNYRAALEHAKARGGKVFRVLSKDIPPEWLEGIETGPAWIPPKGSGGIPIRVIKELTPDLKDRLWKIYVRQIPKEGPLFEEVVKARLISDITDGVTAANAGKWDRARRVFDNIKPLLENNEIQIEDLPNILKKHNLTPMEFAELYHQEVSKSGRILKWHSDVAKRISKVFKDSPKASAILEGAEFADDFWGALAAKWMKTENVRRGMLVSQTATALRNTWSQTGRITIGTLDEALQSVILGRGDLIGTPHGPMNTLVGAWHALTPSGRKALTKILDSEQAVVAGARLFSQPVHEVTVSGNVSKFVNILNRTQEFYFRRVAFEAKLRQLTKIGGKALDAIDPKTVPKEVFEQAVDYALEMTFAASPKGKVGKEFLKAWTRFGLTTVQPFPRFNYFNAIPFIVEHSPAGLLRAMSPRSLQALASGDPTKFAKHATRGAIGTMMFDAAWRIRQSDLGGDRWYEINVSEDPKTGKKKVVDTRAFAPLSTPLFIAEVFTHPERIRTSDWVMAGIGMSRLAGSGLAIADIIRARKGETRAKLAQRVVGEYMGGFTTWLRQFRDFWGQVETPETYYKDTRENRILGPAIRNIPFAHRFLPEAVSPTRGRMRAEQPLLRQLTGLTIRTKTMMDQELDKIGMDWIRVWPRTGNPEADRYQSAQMVPVVNRLTPVLINSPKYKRLSNPAKQEVMGLFWQSMRGYARQQMTAMRPDLAARLKIEDITDTQAALIKDVTGIDVNILFPGWRK